jgi:DNA-binding CsgD family transcriptional regulator
MTSYRFDLLSDREMEVLQLSADGLKPKVIAQRLSLSERTVYAHLSSAAKKLGATSASEAAVALARRDALGTFAKPAEQSLQVAPGLLRLIDLLLPELSGKRYNDLNAAHRLVVIVSRTMFFALSLLAVASLVRDIGRVLGQTD